GKTAQPRSQICSLSWSPTSAAPPWRRAVAALAGFGAVRRRLDAYVLQQGLRRPAVDLQAVGLLVGADQRTRVHSSLAVDLGDGVAQPLQLLLDLLDALGGQLPDIGPGRAEVAAADNAVAEVADK